MLFRSYARPIEGRIGIVTVSGGHGAIAVDACTARGLSVPGLPDNVREDLRQNLSPSVQDIAALTNPVDLTGSGIDEDFVATVKSFCAMENIDCVLALLLPYIPGITSDLGAKLGGIARQCGTPLIAYVPNVEKYAMLIEGFTLNGSPVAHSIEGAVLMADALRRNRP